MSLPAMTRAMQLRRLKAIQFRLLLNLAHHHNHNTGDCFPSQETLAEECEISIQSVRDHLDALEEMGLIRRSRRVGNLGECRGTNYDLALNTTKPANPAGWVKDGDLVPNQPAELSEPNRQLFAGSYEPRIEPLPPLSPHAEFECAKPWQDIGYTRHKPSTRPASGHRQGDRAKEVWPEFDALCRRVADDPRFREPWVLSWLARCKKGPSGELVAANHTAYERLSRSGVLQGFTLVRPAFTGNQERIKWAAGQALQCQAPP